MSAVSVVNEREIQPMLLSLEQLHTLKSQHEEELGELQKQLDTLSAAKSRFLNAKISLNDISTSENGTFLYVPLSSSLYVPGKILDNNKVIVELGTNYYCEKTVDEAKELIERKITLISQSIETIEGVGLQKKKNLSQIIQIIQYKAAQANES